MAKVTIKDIAKECGVSAATVSLVLNNRENRISQDTKNRIMKAVQKYNYRPNKLAIGMLKGNTSTLGIIVPDIANIFFASLCKGCEREAQKHGYSLMVASSEEFPEDNMQCFNTLIDHHVDGIVYAAPSNVDDQIFHTVCTKLSESNIPFVAINQSLDLPSAQFLNNDNVHGGYIATKHLLELNHRRIGCVTGPLCNWISQERLKGYQKALLEFDIPYDPALILESDFSLSSGYDCLAYMRGQGATAIFCFNDMLALGVYRAVRDYNLKLPDSISLVGYDDIFFADLLDPPLTTVHQPASEIGSNAICSLISLIKNEPPTNPVIFTPNLKIRSSTKYLDR